MNWIESWRADPAGRPLADRHYNRQKVGAKQYAPAGSCFVLRTPDACALWITSWPFAEFTKHEWAGAWVNSTFRNEGSGLSSELIRQAVAATRWYYGNPPPLGMVTFVNTAVVPGFFRRGPEGRTLEWGYSYWQAGFRHCGWTKENQHYVLQLLPEDMPEPQEPAGRQLEMMIA